MPELAEVESGRNLVQSYCSGQRITAVYVHESGNGPRHGLFDDIVCDLRLESDGIPELNQSHFIDALLNRKLVSACRKGKQIWLELDGNGPSVLFHFGMTGSFVVKGVDSARYVAFKVHDEVWPPKFTKMEIIFENGIQLAFCDPRRLGRIRLRNGDPSLVPPISKLACDPLLDGLSVEYMKSQLLKYSTNIKAVLLDQEKVICGIGNWIADEVLYQANIHPSKACNTLTDLEIKNLTAKIMYVIQTAVAVDARSEDFPKEWLFHFRWSKKNGEKMSPLKMPNGDSIYFETVAGRTSAIVKSSTKVTSKITTSKITTKKVTSKVISEVTSKVTKSKRSLSSVVKTGVAVVAETTTPTKSTNKRRKL